MRTCTMMVYCDGPSGIAKYAVMRGKMRGKAFICADAEVLHVYTLGHNKKPDHRVMTAAHATPEAPPVYWQA